MKISRNAILCLLSLALLVTTLWAEPAEETEPSPIPVSATEEISNEGEKT